MKIKKFKLCEFDLESLPELPTETQKNQYKNKNI